MKKILFLTILILLILPCSALAHQQSKDFFDFESYVGNDDTLAIVPTGGTYGNWGLNNITGSTGIRDGVTSAKTDKGTSMVLVRKNAPYPGVYYSHKSGYHVTDTLHVSFAIKISGTIENGYAIFRFRKPNNSTPYNVLTFSDSGNIAFYGKTYQKDGMTPKYEKDKWYYVDAYYDVESGYTKLNLNDGGDFNIDFEGMSGFEDALNPIQLVMIETTGHVKSGYEGRIYIDDWLVETVPKMYVENKTETFSDFRFSDDGTMVSDDYMMTGFIAKSTNDKPFAGVFKDSLKDGDNALALCTNNNSPHFFWGELKNKIKGTFEFETDLRLCNQIADTCIYLGDSNLYENALKIEAQSGRVYVFGQATAINLIPFEDYHISLRFDMNSKCAVIKVTDTDSIKTSSLRSPFSNLSCVSSYKITYENYLSYGQTQMKTIFDNISIDNKNSTYIAHCDMNDSVLLNPVNNRTSVMPVPKGFENSYHFGYTISPNCENGRAKLMLSGESDECAIYLSISDATVGDEDERIAFDKTNQIKLGARLASGSVIVSAVQNDVTIFEKEIILEDGKTFGGSYLEYEGQSENPLEVSKYCGSACYDFDINEAFVSGEGEYTIKLNNPIDSNALFTAKVNLDSAEYEIVDAYTLKLRFDTENEANITLSGIKDIFGNVKTITAEISETDIKDGYVISNPVFLAEKSGIYTEASEIVPGNLIAVVNIKKADE